MPPLADPHSLLLRRMDIVDFGIYYCVLAGLFLLVLRLFGVWKDDYLPDSPKSTSRGGAECVIQGHKSSLPPPQAVSLISRGEAECGRVLRHLFPQHAFVKVRPLWLMNDWPGRRTPPKPLELDLYCSELKLAVEYNGEQHYRVVPKFHGTGPEAETKLLAQQLRDLNKRTGCTEHGVELVIVRFDVHSVEQFLRAHPTILSRRAALSLS